VIAKKFTEQQYYMECSLTTSMETFQNPNMYVRIATGKQGEMNPFS
jgi:hypothetical protein